MYNGNGTPPFRPPPGGIPPFPPPNMAGGGGAPGAFPPFAPPQGFVPPPFPPNFAPSGPPPAGLSSAGAAGGIGTPMPGMPSPLGVRPPPQAGPGGNMYPPRPAHPGLGLPPLPGGMPTPHPQRFGPGASTPAPVRPPGFVREVKTTSVFVSGISPGITDDMLRDLLNACGPLHELKRVSGAGGKPQAFGFALFESPEVVMRCLRCLNGVELPDLTPEGRAQRKPAKPLVVKVDDKTKQFLDEFEQALGRSDDEESADAHCRKAIANIVSHWTNPNGVPQAMDAPPARDAGGRSPINVIVPEHLKDLKEGDLPENQRVAVLDQIAGFRESSMRWDREKKRQEEEKERLKNLAASQPYQPGPSDYGYGNRGLIHNQRQAAQGGRGGQQGAGAGPGPGSSREHDRAAPTGGKRDPQGYSEPVAFVRAKEAQNKAESDRTDEEEEQLRRQREDRERDAALRERERRVENRERQRIDSLNRELAHRKQQAELEDRSRRHQSRLFEEWDDDEKADRGREWFYTDRGRWRSRRQAQRQREEHEDARDRQAEEDERRQLERESEDFLRRQMEELADLEGKQKSAGLLSEDLAPIKLAIAPPTVPPVKKEVEEAEKKPPPPKPAVEFADDEDEAAQRKRRTFVKLEADDAGAGGPSDGLTEAERQAQRNARLLQLRKRVPTERRALWNQRIEWAAISPSVIERKIVPYIHDEMREFIGEVDEDLAEFVVEQVKARKAPDDFVDGLEPVLAEEAVAFTVKLWRLLTFETMAYQAGMDTGTMLV